MSRKILLIGGGALALVGLLFVAILIGFVLGGGGDVLTPTGERWIKQEVKEEVLRLQKVKRWIEQEVKEAQKQAEEEQP